MLRGFRVGNNTILKGVLGIGIPLIIAVIWGLFMAPRSPKQLQGAAYIAVKVVVFGQEISYAANAYFGSWKDLDPLDRELNFCDRPVLFHIDFTASMVDVPATS